MIDAPAAADTHAMEYVDYRRYADYGKSATTTAIEGARGRPAEARVEEPPAADAAMPEGRLPVWWLFFLPLYWFPQSINWGLIQTYLLPFEVEDIVGQSRKQFFLSLMVTSSNVGSFFGPVWGALSDAAVGKDGRRRRRPIIVVGQLLFVLACTVMATADSFIVLLLSFMLFTMTATISGAPYTVTNTAVPLEQRGLFNALWVRTAALLSPPRCPGRVGVLRAQLLTALGCGCAVVPVHRVQPAL